MQVALVALVTGLVYVLHQDFWFWRTARPLVFGFLPIGLFYHAAYTVAISGFMWFLVRRHWPVAPRGAGTANPHVRGVCVVSSGISRSSSASASSRGGRRRAARGDAEDYFLAGRTIGPVVFLLSLFGTNMTAFSILGASGHAFANGIVTYGLMASSSALVIPLGIFLIGTRLWALGKRHGFMTPVQMFRDRWECGHIGTVIFAVQAVLLIPYIVIAVMGGGTTLRAVSNGLVPYWLGGAVVSLVVMSYVFFGGMRGTAWVNTFQTVLFLSFGAIAVVVIARGMGGFSNAMESLLASPSTAPLLTRERVSPLYFLSYTFIPLSSLAFPHIGIFCLTAKRLSHFRKTVILYPLCMLAIWLPSVFLGLAANKAIDLPAIQAKVEARATLADAGPEPDARTARRAPRRRERRRRDPEARRRLRAAAGWRRSSARR